MIYSIPIGDTSDSSYRINIDSITYLFRFRWNTYDESWQCYVGQTGQDPVCKFKINNGFDMLRQYRHLEGVPDALLYCLDVVTNYARPTKDGIGNDSGSQFKLMLLTGS